MHKYNDLFGDFVITKSFDLNEFVATIRNSDINGEFYGLMTEDWMGSRVNHRHPEINFESVYNFVDGQKIAIGPYNLDDDKIRIIKSYTCCQLHSSELVFSNNLFSLVLPYIENHTNKM